ncbi:hypothetical protein [Spirosoma endbachense]|uniref:Uncharacterized protein n=1 Tax=Spirosoma endbachense TaxID=2666025 RepID=A0A6P1W1B7_9BACT|nr:hypothetical protein [Spirosoma endbachense]QHV99193.1 hypothetical protein GJR95_31140 [Spirosoma endbachense]
MKTFDINGQTFTEGDEFIIETPELGKMQVIAQWQDFKRGSVVMLDLGLVLTPIGCQGKLSFYTNGDGYHTFQLVYVCRCGYNVHNHALAWRDLTIEGNAIKTSKLGTWFNQPHNHALAAEFEHLKPKPKSAQLPEPITGRHGQFQLF